MDSPESFSRRKALTAGSDITGGINPGEYFEEGRMDGLGYNENDIYCVVVGTNLPMTPSATGKRHRIIIRTTLLFWKTQLSGRQLTRIFQRAPQVRAPLNEQTLTRRGFQGENFTTQWVFADEKVTRVIKIVRCPVEGETDR
ncbi:hypothetical protein LXL04_006039 [Taraxacum kok-saghyz]